MRSAAARPSTGGSAASTPSCPTCSSSSRSGRSPTTSTWWCGGRRAAPTAAASPARRLRPSAGPSPSPAPTPCASPMASSPSTGPTPTACFSSSSSAYTRCPPAAEPLTPQPGTVRRRYGGIDARDKTMTIPVLMVVDDNPGTLKALDDVLRHRYGHGYLIISEDSPGTALGRLRELRAADRPVAVMMAAAAMTAASGAEFVAQARGIQPGAKRVLVVPRGGPAAPSLRVPVPLVRDRQAATPVLRAMALGIIDAYLPAPAAERDEGFHRAVSELLEEWALGAAPALPAVRIVGQERSARAHELRDTLARNSIPYVFHTAGSDAGQSWLQQAGQDGSALPVLVMYTGEVLVDPPNERLAAVFGLASLPAGTIDVAIVGAGPAGLSAAVYAASEGLSTLLLEREAIGGQAGSSSLIRNYLGFPRGISGTGLASRAFEQAWSFGAIPSMAGPVTALQPAG